MQKDTGRYSIGQQLIVVAIQQQIPGMGNVPARRWWGVSLLSFADRHFSGARSINTMFKVLTVKEHHKVPLAINPDGPKDCDGYILVDEEGREYRNQHPMANYNQTTDGENRLFSLVVQPNSPMYQDIRKDKTPFNFRLFEDLLDSHSTPESLRELYYKNLNDPANRDLVVATAFAQDTINWVTANFHKHFNNKYEVYRETVFSGVNSEGKNFHVSKLSLRVRPPAPYTPEPSPNFIRTKKRDVGEDGIVVNNKAISMLSFREYRRK